MPLLHWLNRDKDVLAAQAVPYRLLESADELSYGAADSPNMLIQGDNLEALKALLPYYAGQVKCIYIDPPYNTGTFQNVHYDDNIQHSQWLSRIYPRIELLRELLSDDGMIAIQIDDTEFARLYIIMTELFSEKNIKVVCVKMSEPTGVKMASIKKAGSIPKLKEYIILAKKNGLRDLKIDKIPKGKWDSEYKTFVHGATEEELLYVKTTLENEERTQEEINITDEILQKIWFENASSVFKRVQPEDNSNNDKNPKITQIRPDSILLEDNKSEKNTSEDWLYENSWRIVQFVTLTGSARDMAVNKKLSFKDLPPAFSIITNQKKMYAIKADFNHETRLPRCKILFADLYLETHPGDFWQDIKTTGLDNEGSVKFKNGKKPEKLLHRIIKMNTKPNDLVLDSFLGSGTTAAVAHKMGRRWIGIEMGEHAITHCAPRLQKVVDGEQGGISQAINWQGGGGFRFYKLGETIFDASGNINPAIRFPHLAAHIWFCETKTAYVPREKSPLLGVHEGTAFYLLYNGILGDKSISGGNVLTNAILKALPPHDGLKVIYGETSRISAARLKELNIIFKQTPYDVKAR